MGQIKIPDFRFYEQADKKPKAWLKTPLRVENLFKIEAPQEKD
jgi:hypothetical protein